MEQLVNRTMVIPRTDLGAKFKNFHLVGYGVSIQFVKTTGVHYFYANVTDNNIKTGDGDDYASTSEPTILDDGTNYVLSYSGNYKSGTYVDGEISNPTTARDSQLLINKVTKNITEFIIL